MRGVRGAIAIEAPPAYAVSPVPRILEGDCLDVLRNDVEPQSVDLIFTSPPYADQRKSAYGGVHPDDYVEWFLPRAEAMRNCLKPAGSFVLNIKEKAVNGERHTYVLELILALRKQGWLWVEEYVWHKKNAVPGKWPNRFRDSWERLLHFTASKKFKMNQDAVMAPAGDWRKPRLANMSDNDRVRKPSATGSGFGRRIANWEDRDWAYPTNVLHMAAAGILPCHHSKYNSTIPPACCSSIPVSPGGDGASASRQPTHGNDATHARASCRSSGDSPRSRVNSSSNRNIRRCENAAQQRPIPAIMLRGAARSPSSCAKASAAPVGGSTSQRTRSVPTSSPMPSPP